MLMVLLCDTWIMIYAQAFLKYLLNWYCLINVAALLDLHFAYSILKFYVVSAIEILLQSSV